MPKRWSGLCLLIVGAAVGIAPCLTGIAMQPAGADDRDPAVEMVELVIGEDEVEVEDFLRALAMATEVNLVYDPMSRAIRGKRFVGRVRLRVPKGELLESGRQLLLTKDLILVPLGPPEMNTWSVVSLREVTGSLQVAPEVVDLTEENLDAWSARGGRLIATTMHVEHLRDLRSARNALTRVTSGNNIGQVVEVPSARAFVVVDLAPRVVSIFRLLRRLDQPSEGTSTTAGETIAIDLVHGSAEAMAAILVHHYALRPVVLPPGTGPLPDDTAAEGRAAPRITADSRTNRLLVTGSAEEVRRVQEAVALLDRETPADAR